MQINTFRAWFNNTIQQGVGAAKRAGLAVGRRVRPNSDRIDESTNGGEDESSLGGGRGHRAWFDFVEEYIRKFKRFFEKSTFQRFPRLDSFIRKFLGLPPREKPKMVNPFITEQRNYRLPSKPTAEQAENFRRQVESGRYRAQTSEKKNLREDS